MLVIELMLLNMSGKSSPAPPQIMSEYIAYASLTVLAAAYMAPWVSVGSFINYYNHAYDSKFFVWLNTAFYTPGLPMSLLQGAVDERFDILYGSQGVLLFRIVLCFMVIALVCFLLPVYNGNEADVLVLVTFLGIFTWCIHGVVTTVAGMFPRRAVCFYR